MKKYFKSLYKGSFSKLQENILKNIHEKKKMFIVTANPETIMLCEKNKEMNSIIMDKNITVVADGIGVTKAAKKLQINDIHKIPGIDIANYLLKVSNEKKLKISLVGATKEVNQLLVEKINNDFPNIKIISSIDGYDNEKEKKFEESLKLNPDIIMVALGIPKQELFINKYYAKAKKGVFIGVGGSFDVISGSKKRAPKFFLKTNTEWLYRIVREPSRLKRFYNSNIKFYFNLKKESKR